jgi:hypothetical protein
MRKKRTHITDHQAREYLLMQSRPVTPASLAAARRELEMRLRKPKSKREPLLVFGAGE